MMKHFCSAKHYAYKRIEENRNNTEFKVQSLDTTVAKKYNLQS